MSDSHLDLEVARKWETLFTERERKELALAKIYANKFAHGTTGHNQLMIIAKLTDALNRIEDSDGDINALYEPQA